MKKYMILMIGVICLILSFGWMVLEKESTGGFLALAAVSGGIISEGVSRIRKK